MDVTQDDARNLVAKLAATDLTEGERALLDAVFIAASGEDEVSGFGYDKTRPGYTEVEWTYLKSVDGLMASRPGTKWIDVLS